MDPFSTFASKRSREPLVALPVMAGLPRSASHSVHVAGLFFYFIMPFSTMSE